jgi:hypothetical protein
MTEHKKDPAAVALGRKGGRATSAAKTAACRKNIKKALRVLKAIRLDEKSA